MPKRITYLTKRDDLDRDRFRAHWATTHAAIAIDLPGIESYRQNHIVSDGASLYAVDGIVELWFASDDVVGAGLDSDVADRLIEDEQRFLGGIVGGAVRSGGPTPHWSCKVWMLARRSPGSLDDVLSVWASDIAERVGARGHSVNIADDDGPQLTRKTLRVIPEPPQVSICFGFDDVESAISARRFIDEASRGVGDLIGVDVLVSEELVVV